MITSRPSLLSSLTGIIALISIFSLSVLYFGHNASQDLPPSLPFSFPTSINHHDPKWLLAIFVDPAKITRRHIIRFTWATSYAHPSYEFRFILGNYSSSPWAPAIEAENATHGDIWSIEDFTNENYHTANHVKNMEFFKYIVENQGNRFRRYDFVSKVDADIWFNVPKYYDAFIAPRLPDGEKHDSDRLTMIGRPMVWGSPYAYASGRLYTMSWSLVEYFAGKYTEKPISDETEDKLAGLYLYQDRTEHEFVSMELEQAWDIGLENLVDNNTMLIHGIKDDELMLEISTIFGDKGQWNGKEISGLTTFYNRMMKEVVERLGEPTQDEREQLEKSLEDDQIRNPRDTLGWKLIEEKISIEDREAMGTLWPLTLAGNNASTGVIPQPLGTAKRFGY